MEDNKHHIILQRCNELAMRARGRTATNPNVGALVLDSNTGRILGEGWHRSFGAAHAEIDAMEKPLRHNTLLHQAIAVSLEPCNHTGKTPPCTAAIMKHRLSRVIVDQMDPDPRMNGRSIDLLRMDGIAIPTPADTSLGRQVLRPFYINTRLRRPFLRLKMAVSRDNFIGQAGKQVKITNDITNRWVHRLRNETQAIMAGTRTILNDNPALTSRYGNLHHPVRIIPDRRGILPDNLRIFSEPGENIILTLSHRTSYRGQIVQMDPMDLPATFQMLYEKFDIGSILVEGGRQLFSSLFEVGMWDELVLIRNSEKSMHTGIQAPDFPVLPVDDQIILGADTIDFINNPEPR